MARDQKNLTKNPERKKPQGQTVIETAPKNVSKTDECTKSGKKCKSWGKKNGGTCSKFGRLCTVTRT